MAASSTSERDDFDALLGLTSPDNARRSRRDAASSRPSSAASTGRGTKRSRGKRAPRLTFVGVLGELLMTFGVIMLCFVGWKYWLNDIIVGRHQNEASSHLSQELAQNAGGQQVDAHGVPLGEVPMLNAQRFAILYVPEFGVDYMRPIAQGTDYSAVLSDNIGHYPDSAMPGEPGNFAIAGHRLAYGAPMQRIHELKLGDEIIVETSAGWYTYEFRSGEYLSPSTIDAVAPVPHHPEEKPEESIITLQSCNPYWSTAERIMAYGTLKSFTPRAEGPPASIKPTLELYGVK